MDRGAWGAPIHRVTKSQTRLSNSTAQHSKQGERGENVVIRTQEGLNLYLDLYVLNECV